jgi:hypothetical protein
LSLVSVFITSVAVVVGLGLVNGRQAAHRRLVELCWLKAGTTATTRRLVVLALLLNSIKSQNWRLLVQKPKCVGDALYYKMLSAVFNALGGLLLYLLDDLHRVKRNVVLFTIIHNCVVHNLVQVGEELAGCPVVLVGKPGQ